jgi:hypothetical protein
MERYLNLSELAYVRHRAAEIMRNRRPRRAGRVRAFAAMSTPHPEPRPRPHGSPMVPRPRRPMDTAPLEVLRAVLCGLQQQEAAL